MYSSINGDTNRIFQDIEQNNFTNKQHLVSHIYQSCVLTILLSPGYLTNRTCLCAVLFANMFIQIIVPIHQRRNSNENSMSRSQSILEAQKYGTRKIEFFSKSHLPSSIIF